MEFLDIDANEAVRQLISGEARMEYSQDGSFFVNKDGRFKVEVKAGWAEQKTTDA